MRRRHPSRAPTALVPLLALAVVAVTAAPPFFGAAPGRVETTDPGTATERSHEVLRAPGAGARSPARLVAPDLKIGMPSRLALPVAGSDAPARIGDARRQASIDDRSLRAPRFGPSPKPTPPRAPPFPS